MKEWETEPDYEEFMIGEVSCKIIRNDAYGHLCGYVGVKKNHALYQKSASTGTQFFNVHGNVTYAGFLGDKEYWYFGFDCGHFNDLQPRLPDLYLDGGLPSFMKAYVEKTGMDPSFFEKESGQSAFPRRTYRNWAFVKQEVEGMAEVLIRNKLRFVTMNADTVQSLVEQNRREEYEIKKKNK